MSPNLNTLCTCSQKQQACYNNRYHLKQLLF